MLYALISFTFPYTYSLSFSLYITHIIKFPLFIDLHFTYKYINNLFCNINNECKTETQTDHLTMEGS